MKKQAVKIIFIGLLGIGVGYGVSHLIPSPGDDYEDTQEPVVNLNPVSDKKDGPPSLREAENDLRQSSIVEKLGAQINLRWDTKKAFFQDSFVDADVFSLRGTGQSNSNEYKEAIRREVIFVLNDYLEDFEVRVSFPDERRKYWSLRDGELDIKSDEGLSNNSWVGEYESGPFTAESLIQSVLSDDVRFK